MRFYKLLLLLNLFANINSFMIRPSTSNHNLYKLSRTYSTIFTQQTPTITNNLKKVSSQPQLNIKSLITNKCKKEDSTEELEKFILTVVINSIKYFFMYYIIYHYIYHII
jgi:hypothetical protein